MEGADYWETVFKVHFEFECTGLVKVAVAHILRRPFGTPFSQFVKGTTQLVYNRRLWGDNWLVSRVALGAARAIAGFALVMESNTWVVLSRFV